MANRQVYVVGALGVLVGMVVGVSSAQNAQTVSFAGHNPNDAQGFEHRTDRIPSIRSATERLDVRNSQGIGQWRTPPRTSLSENTARRLEYRHGQQGTLFEAAPVQTVRGVPAQLRQRVGDCDRFSSVRYTRCLQSALDGETYEANYFPIEY